MSKTAWVGMHALLGGITAGIVSLATAAAVTWPAAAVIVGGLAIGYAVWDGIDLLNVVYQEGVGWTPCNIIRAAFDLSLAIFGVANFANGIAAYRASGSWLKWMPNIAKPPLSQPSWVRNGGSFVNWMLLLEEEYKVSGRVLTRSQIDEIVILARQYGVKVRGPEIHPKDPVWNVWHINIGNEGQAHIPVPPGYTLP